MNSNASTKNTESSTGNYGKRPRRAIWIVGLLAFLAVSSAVAITDRTYVDDPLPYLKLWLKLDDGSGTSAVDSSGYGNSGTLNDGAAFTGSGQIGGAADFDGTNDDITVPDSNSLDFTQEVTMEAWVIYDAGLSGANKPVFNKLDAYDLYVSDGTIRFVPGSQSFVASATTVRLNVWYHLVATYDGETARIYVNGTLDASAYRPGTMPIGTAAVNLMQHNNFGQNSDGRIDNVRLFNRSLTAQQVTRLYANNIEASVLEDMGRQSTLNQVWAAVNASAGGDTGAQGDEARQSTLLQVWAQDNATFAELLAARNTLWSEINQTQARQSNYWTDYNDTEAAGLASQLQARDILWNELNQTQARQSLFWAAYNSTESANLNKLLTSLAATEANLTAILGDMARQSSLLQLWARENQTFAEVIAGRDVLWSELNQSASRQSNYWQDYNETEAATFAELLAARNTLWNEANQSAARQSLYWAAFNETLAQVQSRQSAYWTHYNATESANLNKLLTSLAATEANLTALIQGINIADMARQSTSLQIWSKLNATFDEIAAARVDIASARAAILGEIGQVQSRQSTYWAAYNATESANLNKILASLGATEANLTLLHANTFGYLHDFEARLNATLAAGCPDCARQSTLNQAWNQINLTGSDLTAKLAAARDILWAEVNSTSSSTAVRNRDILWAALNGTRLDILGFVQDFEARLNQTLQDLHQATVTVTAPPTTQFLNDTRYWEAFVFAGNSTDSSAAGEQLLSAKNFTITKPYDMALVNRTAILEGHIHLQNNATNDLFKSWQVRVDNSSVPGCVFKRFTGSTGIGVTLNDPVTSDYLLTCNQQTIADGQHNISIWRDTSVGGGVLVNSTSISFVYRMTDTISWPSVQGVFVQPVLTPIMITVPSFVTVTMPTFITVVADNDTLLSAIEAQSMQFGGLDTNQSWTVILWLVLMVWALYNRWVLIAAISLAGLLEALLAAYGVNLPIGFKDWLLLLALGIWAQSFLDGWRLKNNKRDETNA